MLADAMDQFGTGHDVWVDTSANTTAASVVWRNARDSILGADQDP